MFIHSEKTAFLVRSTSRTSASTKGKVMAYLPQQIAHADSIAADPPYLRKFNVHEIVSPPSLRRTPRLWRPSFWIRLQHLFLGKRQRHLIPLKSTAPRMHLDPTAPPVPRNPFGSPSSKQFGALDATCTTAATTQITDSPPISSIATPGDLKPTEFEGRAQTEKETATSPSPQNTMHYVTTKPTCSLNLVCYRLGARGCELHQIRAVKGSALTKMPSTRNL